MAEKNESEKRIDVAQEHEPMVLATQQKSIVGEQLAMAKSFWDNPRSRSSILTIWYIVLSYFWYLVVFVIFLGYGGNSLIGSLPSAAHFTNR
jgi:hypothetical protein